MIRLCWILCQSTQQLALQDIHSSVLLGLCTVRQEAVDCLLAIKLATLDQMHLNQALINIQAGQLVSQLVLGGRHVKVFEEDTEGMGISHGRQHVGAIARTGWTD